MKKSKTKKFILIAVIGIVAIFAGGIMFVSAMSNAGWDFTKLDREVLTEASFSTESEIKSVALEGSWNYEIVHGDQFSIQYYESDLSEITVTENAGTVTLSEKRNGWNWFTMFNGIARGSVKVVVTVTGDIDLRAQGSSLDVVAKGGFNFINITIEGSSADLTIENMSVSGSVSVEGSSAEAVLKNAAVSGSVTIDGSSADLVMENVTVAGAVIVDGSSAEAVLSGVKAESLSVIGSSAKAVLSKSEIFETLKLDGSSVKAVIENSSVKAIEVDGSSGKVIASNADIGSMTGEGSSFDAELNLVGTKNDILSVTATGSSAKVVIDGVKGDYNGTGHKVFSAAGSSAKITINFLGGESIF